MEIKIRDANREDVTLVARSAMAAAHLNDFPEVSEHDAELFAVCAREDTLYSFRNSRIITVDDIPAGCMISYSGDGYMNARVKTFGMAPAKQAAGIAATDIEAYPGEWYLDSLAILPAYRKRGLARMLMADAIKTGRGKGYRKFSLIVEKGSDDLIRFYSSFGFKVERELRFFGDEYLRMVKE